MKGWKRKTVIDPQTGEVHDLFFVVAPKRIDIDYVKVFIPFVEEIFSDKDLVGKAFRLLLWIVKRLNWNDLSFHMNSKIVCKELEISERTYYLWKKKLIEKGIIRQSIYSKEIFYLRPHTIIKGRMQKVMLENDNEIQEQDEKRKQQEQQEENNININIK